jgi:D-glycero-alpha-D-manno-heptose-7-phosphate kinase
VRKVEISDDRKTEIKDNLMLFYTGIMRTADNVSASYVTNIEERAERLNKMSQFVNEGIDILTGDMSLDSLGKLFHENWVEKRDLSKLVSNPRVDNIYDAARAAGALGGKLTGAGGGGMMLLYVPKSRQNHVREALSGLLFIPFHFSDTGSEIIFQDQQKRYDETVSRPRDLESFIEVSEL